MPVTLSESLPVPSTDASPPVAEHRSKIRLRFRKDGDLRLVSHHDLMRALERAMRRAAIPFRTTSGFHPQPRMVFALSMSLGIVGITEAVEIELTQPISPEDLLARLSLQCPAGLTFLSAREVPFNRTAQVRRMVYQIDLPPERVENVQKAIDALLPSSECFVIRLKPTARRINIRPYIREIRLSGITLELDLWVQPTGTARADELLGLLGVRDCLQSGGVLVRSELEIIDELDPALLAQGPDPAQFQGLSQPLDRLPEHLSEIEESVATADWGASPNGPVVE